VVRDAVLVIDDDPDFRDLVDTVLGFQGISVFSAADCREGLALLVRERQRIALILLDYWMPGMSPVHCAACLRAHAGEDIQIVLVTAAANTADRATELGIARWLSKPFGMEQLGHLARSALGKEGA
jgi:DNA-binding response OmpR family regulator